MYLGGRINRTADGLDVKYQEKRRIKDTSSNQRMSNWVNCDIIKQDGQTGEECEVGVGKFCFGPSQSKIIRHVNEDTEQAIENTRREIKGFLNQNSQHMDFI